MITLLPTSQDFDFCDSFEFSDFKTNPVLINHSINKSPFRRFPQFPIIRRKNWKCLGVGDIEIISLQIKFCEKLHCWIQQIAIVLSLGVERYNWGIS
jgi:hypothetical protein